MPSQPDGKGGYRDMACLLYTSALPTPIDQFAKNYLGLRVSFARLSPDGSICGVTAYADTCLLYTSRCV